MAKRGPKSSYKTEYCQRLIDLMSEGKTKSQVCKELKISRYSFHTYRQQFPEFEDAVKEGEFQAEAWWTELGRDATLGKKPNFNATAWIFNMKNQFGWRDKQDFSGNIDHTVSWRKVLERASRK